MQSPAKKQRFRLSELSLAQKGLFFIVLPAVLQVALTAWIATLHYKATTEAVATEKAREVSEDIGIMMKSGYDVVTAVSDSIEKREPLSVTYFTASQQLKDSAGRLQTNVRGNPHDEQVVDECLKYMNDFENLAEYAMQHPSEYPEHSEPRSDLFKQLRAQGKHFPSLQLLANENRKIVIESPDRQRQIAQQVNTVLLLGTAADVALLSVAGLLFAKVFVRQLVLMIDNTNRLAAQLPLNPPIQGNDEIAILDTAFHHMADSLVELVRKERAIVENARDVICTLDDRHKFVDVSSASKNVLDYSPDELIGRRLIDLVVPDDQQQALQELSLVMEGAEEPPFEIRLMRKDGVVIDVVWSSVWSRSERTMFCVVHDISERKRAEQLRQEVVQMVSHDLRSPLFAIQGVLEMLQEGMIGSLDAEQRKLLAAADRSAARMLTLVNDLLDIERLEAGMLELDKKVMPLEAAFEQALHTVQTLADAKRIALQVVPTDLRVFADCDRIVQILINLLSNAIKFSPENAVIVLGAEQFSDMARIKVIDRGRGIPPHMAKAIFERFKQVETRDAQKSSGTGLGLAICKALVELHGGEIHVESEPGQGSQFIFTLPQPGSSISLKQQDTVKRA
jgi:PAS domain S-box-containing protein